MVGKLSTAVLCVWAVVRGVEHAIGMWVRRATS
jgi:hypothetical protein